MSEMSSQKVCPKPDFLKLLRCVGASGTISQEGELFTYKQLCFFLREYIKSKELYDPYDVRVIHCATDPLGEVFGVETFTITDVLPLVLKSIIPLKTNIQEKYAVADSHLTVEDWQQLNQHLQNDSSHQFSSTNANHSIPTQSSQQVLNMIGLPRTASPINRIVTSTVSTPPKEPVNQFLHQEVTDDEAEPYKPQTSATCDNIPNSPSMCDNEVQPVTTQSSPKPQGSQEVLKETTRTSNPKKKRKRKKKKDRGSKTNKGNGYSSTDYEEKQGRQRRTSFSIFYNDADGPTKSSEGRGRTRQSSVSIIYSDADPGTWGSYPWFFQVRLDESGESEVLSVQSKETALVKDSSDDLWFLESEGEDSVSFQLEENSFSIQIQDNDPPFEEEYEVDSDQSQGSDKNFSDDTSSEEELIVVCHDSDVEFWADSESSDAESCYTSDDELSDVDKWECEECRHKNTPVRSSCDKCWKTRDDWFSHSKESNKSKSDHNSNIECPNIGPLEAPKLLSPPITLSTEVALTQGQDFTENNITELQRSSSCDTLLLSDVDDGQMDREKSTSLPCVSHMTTLETSTSVASTLSTLYSLSERERSFGFPSAMEKDVSFGMYGITEREGNYSVPCLRKLNDDSGIELSQVMASSQESISSQVNCVTIDSAGERKRPYPFLSGSYEDPSSIKQKAQEVRTEVPGVLSQENLSVVHAKEDVIPNKILGMKQDGRSVDACMICLTGPKESSIIHGKTGHQICCYRCAKRLKKKGKPCPVCRKPIDRVIRNFVV